MRTGDDHNPFPRFPKRGIKDNFLVSDFGILTRIVFSLTATTAMMDILHSSEINTNNVERLLLLNLTQQAGLLIVLTTMGRITLLVIITICTIYAIRYSLYISHVFYAKIEVVSTNRCWCLF